MTRILEADAELATGTFRLDHDPWTDQRRMEGDMRASSGRRGLIIPARCR